MTGAVPRIDARVLRDRLSARVESLCKAVLPEGRAQGGEWRADVNGGKFVVALKGDKRGRWLNVQGDERGDVLSLIYYTVGRQDWRETFSWARSFCGLENGAAGPARAAPARAPAREPDPAGEHKRRTEQAQGRWSRGLPLAGTPAEDYLRERCIELARLPHRPPMLRFVPDAWHAAAGSACPAMMGGIVHLPDGEISAVHVTYLSNGPGGRWMKFGVHPAKVTMGVKRGGIIPISRGNSKHGLCQLQGPEACTISEGIEDALTAAILFPAKRALAAIDVANLAQIELPEQLTEILLILQRDPENDEVAKCRARAIKRWKDEGRKLTYWHPPERCKDINDYWQGWCHARGG